MSYLLRCKPNDGRVAVEETFLEGVKDHVVINANHNNIVRSKHTLHQIRKFLIDGRFEHGKESLGIGREVWIKGMKKMLKLKHINGVIK